MNGLNLNSKDVKYGRKRKDVNLGRKGLFLGRKDVNVKRKDSNDGKKDYEIFNG